MSEQPKVGEQVVLSLDSLKPQDESNSVGLSSDLMVLTNGWNDKNERMIISIGENAASYKWMHEKSSSTYQTVSQIMSIVMIIITTGLSAESIIPQSNSNQTITILRNIFTYLATVLSVLYNFLAYEKLANQHTGSAMAFSKLYHDIQQQMCMYRRDRINATKYVSDVLKQYDSIVVGGPPISQQTVQQYKVAFKNADISMPDIADRIQKIEIITEPSAVPQTVSKDITLGNVCKLEQIHSAFQIHGDISDKDIQNANADQLRDLRKRYLEQKFNHEYQRSLQHFPEN
jgi:hypothetical protein